MRIRHGVFSLKRTLALPLCALLTFYLCLVLLPTSAQAADGDVYIGGIQVAGGGKSGKQYVRADGSSGTSSDYAIEYDPTVSPAKITVTRNATIGAAYHDRSVETSSCICSDISLEICIESGKKLTLSNPSTVTNPTTGGPTDYDHGIHLFKFGNSELSITGGGTLDVTVTGGASKQKSLAIYAGSVVVSGSSTVTTTSGAAMRESYGVITIESLTVEAGSSLTANGGSVSKSDADALTSGVKCASLTVGGTITATGGTAKRCSYGVYVTTGDLNMTSGGELSGTGGIAEQSSCGVWAEGNLSMDGSTLTGLGGDISDSSDGLGYSRGVYVGGSISNAATNSSIAGTGGTVTRTGYAAYSYGVEAVSISLTTADACSITGNGSAATASASSANSHGIVANAITVNAGSVTGTGGGSRAGSNNTVMYESISCGVLCRNVIKVGTGSGFASLTGTGGIADKTSGYDYGCSSAGVLAYGTIEVGAKGTLNGTGGESYGSAGVQAPNQTITIEGVMTAKSANTGHSNSYGVSCGSGRIALSGKLTASAVAASAQSYGVGAGGIALSGSGWLIASTGETTAQVEHAAKPVKTSSGHNALTAGTSAVWRESASSVFEPLSFRYDDMVAHQRIEAINDGGITASAAPAAPRLNETVTLTPTPAAAGRYTTYTWYSNTANAYDGSGLTTLGGNTVTATAAIQYCYCVGTTATGEQVRSNIVAVTAASYGITLDKSGTWRFIPSTLIQGYTDAQRGTITVTVTNTGNQPTGRLAILLGNPDAASFVLSANILESIPAGGNASFTVKPVIGLTADGTNTKTHQAQVTVEPAAENPNPIAAQSFTVQQKVAPASTVSITGASVISPGASTVLTAKVTGGSQPYTYVWSAGATPDAANPFMATVSPVASTSYTVTVTDFYGETIISAPFTVNVYVASMPTPPQTGDSTPLALLVGLVLCASAGLALSVRRKKRG